MEDDNHKFVYIPSLQLWKIVDVYLHHGGKFVGEPKTELHLYYEHSQVDDPLELNEEEIRELERVEAERREQEAELKRKQEEIGMMEQEAAEKRKQEEIERMEQKATENRRQEEEMERMVPEVRDWDEEDDDMEFDPSIQPGLEEMQCANATVEARQVRTRKKSVAVKKRKQKEKGKEKVQEVSKHKRPSYKSKDRFKMTIQTDVAGDHDDTIPVSPASPRSPPANVGDDVEETPTMDDRLSDGYKSEELESLAGDLDEENDKFPMYNAENNRIEEITVRMEFENLDVFKMALRNTNIVVGREVNFMKNDMAKVRAYCIEKRGDHSCQWKIYCVLNKKTNTYQVMTYDPKHTCGIRIENKLATREWVAEKLIPKLRTQTNMSAQQVFEFFVHTYQVKLHDAMVFRAIKLAKQKCECEEREQYAMLRDYAREILRSNPSSTILLQV
ncbi:hypothetical protein CRG98_028245 [Punica granatum]|uniref:Uncharacterized protein n=1 Tax=Punica granatum TaxID=22663 RepID=A0A2I0J579_PUNGR|nr:hypothetical protein CRG98_028245 [Punica granatum]